MKSSDLEIRLYDALKRIVGSHPPERLQDSKSLRCGLDYQEALEMSYDNVRAEAKRAIHGVRIRRK